MSIQQFSIFMAAQQDSHYILLLSFLLSFFFRRLFSAVADWTSTRRPLCCDSTTEKQVISDGVVSEKSMETCRVGIETSRGRG